MLRFLVVTAICFLYSCTSMKSLNKVSKDDAGISYFMPMKDLVITVKTKDELDSNQNVVIESVTIGTSIAYPDYSQQYMLQHKRSIIADNEMNIAVTSVGLLTTANSKYVSKIGTTFANLASSLGSAESAAGNLLYKNTKSYDCIEARTYIINHPFKDGKSFKAFCNLEVTINEIVKPDDIIGYSQVKKTYSGVFYKQNIPYLVTITNSETCSQCDKCIQCEKCNQKYGTCEICSECDECKKCSNNKSLFYKSKIVLSPSISKTHYMAIPKSLFANTNSQLGFVDGVIESANIKTEGEITALLQYPATIIKAYFTAIGEIFNLQKDNADSESAYLQNSLELQILKEKFTQCLAAVGSPDVLETLGCTGN